MLLWLDNNFFSFLRLLTATLPRSEDSWESKAFSSRHWPGLWWALYGVPLLPLPAHCGLWGLRLGLDHCAQTLQGQLLLWRVWAGALAEIPTHAPGEQGQPSWHCGTLLHPHQDVTHQHALLQPPGANHIRQNPVHGCGPLWLLLSTVTTTGTFPRGSSGVDEPSIAGPSHLQAQNKNTILALPQNLQTSKLLDSNITHTLTVYSDAVPLIDQWMTHYLC